MKTILTAKNLSAGYHKKSILPELTFDIKQGSFTTLIGSNGVGKSTLLRTIAGYQNRLAGQIDYLGQDPENFSFNREDGIFLVHEDVILHLPVSLQDLTDSYSKEFPRWNQDLYQRCIKERKLDTSLGYYQLSRGQKMQFLLIFGLASGVRLLLCDEITSVLDSEAQFYFLEELKAFTTRGGTVVITTNILSELDAYTDNLILINKNGIFINSSMAELGQTFVLYKDVSPEVVEKYGLVKVRPREGFEYVFLSDRSITEVGPESILKSTPTLEDVFLFSIRSEKGYDKKMVA